MYQWPLSFCHLNLTGSNGAKRKVYGGSDSKESACNAGDPGLIPWLGRSPGERNGNPLQYSCLKNSMDRGTRLATVQFMGWQRAGHD